MATSSTTTETKIKPKRSVVERVIVQGGIVVLLIIVAFEGVAYMQMKSAHSKLLGEIQKSESNGSKLTKDIVVKLLGGRQPNESVKIKAIAGEEVYELYYFQGLLKRREMCVHYGVQGRDGGAPEVVEVSSNVPDEVLAKMQK